MFKKIPNYENLKDLYRFVIGLVLSQRQTRPRDPETPVIAIYIVVL